MSRWREKVFVALARNAASPLEYFGLPDERTIAVGSRIPVWPTVAAIHRVGVSRMHLKAPARFSPRPLK
jgi:hypothetical protein